MVVILRGCVVAAVGLGAAGTIAYVRGDLEAVESESLEDVYQATLQAVEELDLRLIYKSRDALSATITARDAQDKKIRITLKNNSRENDENLDSHRNIRYRNKIKAYLSADTR